MQAMVEIFVALLAVWGVLSLGWLLFGRLLTPAGGGRVCSLIPARGDGESLEQSVTALLWLQGGNLLSGPVTIVDCGLTSTGRAVAAALCLREPSVTVCAAEGLEEYIRNRS